MPSNIADAPLSALTQVYLDTLKIHPVALLPFIDVASADATLGGWPIDTVAGYLVGSSPAGAHKCQRCGSESVWQAASAVAAHLAHESDSD